LREYENALFDKNYLLRTRLRLANQGLGGMRDQRGLCIGKTPAGLRARLEAGGGSWDFTEERGTLPFEDGRYDRVLLMDHLEWVDDDYAFIADVHRVLKSAGVLVVGVDHRKRWTVWRPVRRLLGVGDGADDRVRVGYTTTGLFDVLKDGFDVQETRSYSRFFVEGVETITRLVVGVWLGSAMRPEEEDDEAEREWISRRLYNIQSVALPFFHVAAWLDWLLFFTRGYHLMAVARRRLWKPRRTPVLRDGRTLADATLNTRIGTAADF
jgi:SAM-dependent methyltransferase